MGDRVASVWIGVEAQSVFWICPPLSETRHATKRRPGSLQQGCVITALGGCEVKVPLATSGDRLPRGEHVDRCCPDCMREVNELQCGQVIWDF